MVGSLGRIRKSKRREACSDGTLGVDGVQVRVCSREVGREVLVLLELAGDVMAGFIGKVLGTPEACSDGKSGGAGFQLQEGSM